MKFIDEAKVNIRSGKGGDGSVSFRREKNLEFGGPDGGNGGHGGDVVAICVAGLNTLIDFRFRKHFKAKTGGGGAGRRRSGAGGDDAVLQVPAGTQVFADDGETLIADLVEIGDRTVLARGGDGGRGNHSYKSSTNRAPRSADSGGPSENRDIVMRLRLIADIGLVGLPNAGKSTFLAAVSRARPKLADYPFTTLTPQLGVALLDNRDLVIADIPGLIEGAHEGIGLGDRFLGHVERCKALLHLVDGTADDVAADYHTVRGELEKYDHGVAAKTAVVVLNKCDALSDDETTERRDQLAEACGGEVMVMSGFTGAGVPPVMHALFALTAAPVEDPEPDFKSFGAAS
jgi:GTP-binding protein